MAKQRSRRLRKKLHVGEFQEFGLAYKTAIKAGSNEVLFVDALLDELIDPRGMEFGGWAAGGFVSKAGRGTVTEEDRQALIDWLKQRPEVESIPHQRPAGRLVHRLRDRRSADPGVWLIPYGSVVKGIDLSIFQMIRQ